MVAEQTERERIEDWRELELIKAGYPSEEARVLAVRFDVDLHEAVELIAVRGCDPVTAARILL